MSDALILPAEARERAGKGASRALRREGRVPAVIYGGKEEPTTIHVEEKELVKQLMTGHFMIGMRESFSETSPLEYLSFYLLIRIPGVVIVSAAIAYFTFETRATYSQNFAPRLLPLVLVLVLPQIWFVLTEPNVALTADLLLRVLSDCVIVALGGSLGWWFKLNQMRS